MAGTVADQLAARVLSEHELRPQPAEASIRRAAGANRWLDVELRQAETYWQKRVSYAVDKQAYNETMTAITHRNRELEYARKWDLIKNNPNLVGPNMRNETAVNFLFSRIDASILNYDYVNQQDPQTQAFIKKFRLTPEMLGGIRLSQTLDSGERLVFAADGTSMPTIRWWPRLIRAGSLAAARKEIDDASESLRASGTTDTDANAARLLVAFESLLDEFYRTYPIDEIRSADTRKVLDYRNAERFLKTKLCEIARTPESMTGQGSELRFDPAVDGDHLLALLKFMTMHGLDFAPPTQGNESVYVQLFRMMRELYSYDASAAKLDEISSGLDETLRGRLDQRAPQPATKPGTPSGSP